MKFLVHARDYFYPMHRGEPSGEVKPTYAQKLAILDYPEALGRITRMRADFTPAGWARDYWMTMVDDYCTWTPYPWSDGGFKTECGAMGEDLDHDLLEQWCPCCGRVIREVE